MTCHQAFYLGCIAGNANTPAINPYTIPRLAVAWAKGYAVGQGWR